MFTVSRVGLHGKQRACRRHWLESGDDEGHGSTSLGSKTTYLVRFKPASIPRVQLYVAAHSCTWLHIL